VETIVEPNIKLIRKGIIIRFATKLGSELGGISARRNLSRSLMLPIPITRVVGIPEMVFTNQIMTFHGNNIVNPILMNLMAVRGCRSVDDVHSKGGFREPIVVMAPISYQKDSHYVKLNSSIIKYLNFFLNVDPNVHVKVFNFIVKINVETFEKYIINAFSYTLKDMTLDWCHNYMSKFLNYTI
jgi:hypothetical protein